MKNGHQSFKKVDSKMSYCRLDMNYMFFLIDPPPRLGAEHVALPANGRGYWRAWESLFVLCMSL